MLLCFTIDRVHAYSQKHEENAERGNSHSKWLTFLNSVGKFRHEVNKPSEPKKERYCVRYCIKNDMQYSGEVWMALRQVQYVISKPC